MTYNTAEKRQASDKAYYEKNRASILAQTKSRYANDPEFRERTKARVRAWKESKPEKKYRTKDRRVSLLAGARERCATTGLPCTISIQDFELPERCPILGVKLVYDHTKPAPDSPSLDRIDNAKGYVPGNVRVISRRANSLKSDMTLEQVERLAAYMRGEL